MFILFNTIKNKIIPNSFTIIKNYNNFNTSITTYFYIK